MKQAAWEIAVLTRDGITVGDNLAAYLTSVDRPLRDWQLAAVDAVIAELVAESLGVRYPVEPVEPGEPVPGDAGRRGGPGGSDSYFRLDFSARRCHRAGTVTPS